MIYDVYPGSRIWIFFHPESRIRIQGSEKHRIPSPDPHHGKFLKNQMRNARQDSFREIIDNKIFPESKLKARKKSLMIFFTNTRFGCFGKLIILRNNICVLGKSLFIIHSQNITLETYLRLYTFLRTKFYHLFPVRAFCA